VSVGSLRDRFADRTVVVKRPETEVRRRVEAVTAACGKSGVEVAHRRLEIRRGIAGSLGHPDAATVFRGVGARVPTASLDTAYRTLRLVSGVGLIAGKRTRSGDASPARRRAKKDKGRRSEP
jgi:Fe2+ or Zn2+ uptake regulation protein